MNAGNSSALFDRINRIDRKNFFIPLISQFRSLILCLISTCPPPASSCLAVAGGSRVQASFRIPELGSRRAFLSLKLRIRLTGFHVATRSLTGCTSPVKKHLTGQALIPYSDFTRKGFTHRILSKYSTTCNCFRYFFILHMTYFRL